METPLRPKRGHLGELGDAVHDRSGEDRAGGVLDQEAIDVVTVIIAGADELPLGAEAGDRGEGGLAVHDLADHHRAGRILDQEIRSAIAQEIAGAIFVWFGDALHQDPAPFDPPIELVGEDYSSFPCYADWNASWRYVYDNLMDPMHGTFLHANSHTMSQGDTQAVFVTRDTPHGFFFEKAGQRDVNFDWSEFVDNGALYVRLEIPYPASGGPGGNFGIVSAITPIDDTNSACFFWRFRKVSGWQRNTWRFLYKTTLEPRHWQVLEQDRELMDGCGLGLEKHEMLYQHDAGLIRLRRYLAQQARAQLTELRGAGKA